MNTILKSRQTNEKLSFRIVEGNLQISYSGFGIPEMDLVRKPTNGIKPQYMTSYGNGSHELDHDDFEKCFGKVMGYQG